MAVAHLLHSSKASLFVALSKWLSAIRITHGIQTLHLVPRLLVIVTLGITIERGFQNHGIKNLRVEAGVLAGISPGWSQCTLKVELSHNLSGSNHSERHSAS